MRERPPPPGISARIDWVKDETHAARQTDTPVSRHTDTHRPGKQPPSVRLGTHERQLDTHTSDSRQRGSTARGRGKQRLCSVASGAHPRKPQNRRARLRMGVGTGRLGEGLQRAPRCWHTRAPPQLHQLPDQAGTYSSSSPEVL